MNITITAGAEDYLAELLDKQDKEGMAVRLFITQPGTPYAETCLAYCPPEEVDPQDEILQKEKVRFYIEPNSLPFLDEAYIDFATDRMGGQLTIKAPNSKTPKVGPDSPMADQINYVLYNEINPGLAAHGGEVRLLDIIEQPEGATAILEFGGGCQGCSAVDMTLKEGVEKVLVAKIEGLIAVKDQTDHSYRENAYYR